HAGTGVATSTLASLPPVCCPSWRRGGGPADEDRADLPALLLPRWRRDGHGGAALGPRPARRARRSPDHHARAAESRRHHRASASHPRVSLRPATAVLRPSGAAGGALAPIRRRPEPRAVPRPGCVSGGGGKPPRLPRRDGADTPSSESSSSSPLVA